MDIHKFHKSLLRLNETNSIDEINTLTSSFASQLGFDTFVYALRIPTQFSESKVIVTSTYPESWLAHYFENDYSSNDPVLGHCTRHIVPIQWEDVAAEASLRGSQIMHEAAEFGLREGVSVPVHSPHGELGIFSMSLDRTRQSAREITTHSIPYAHLLSAYVHEAVKRVSDLSQPQLKQNTLSLREKECLRWAADGKTSWEIANVLNLSERTVNFHLKNAAVKLEVFSRQHAVVKAIMKGLIQPKPF